MPLTLVFTKERKGYNNAVKDALKIPKNNIISFSDSSGQHNPKDFFKLAKEIGRYDMIIGYKSFRKDDSFRIILSRVYNFLTRLLFGTSFHDINCSFRVIKKEVVQNVLKETKTFEKYCVFSEFTLRAQNKGYLIKDVPISHSHRKIGKKKTFFISNIIPVVAVIIWDLIKPKMSLSKKWA